MVFLNNMQCIIITTTKTTTRIVIAVYFFSPPTSIHHKLASTVTTSKLHCFKLVLKCKVNANILHQNQNCTQCRSSSTIYSNAKTESKNFLKKMKKSIP